MVLFLELMHGRVHGSVELASQVLHLAVHSSQNRVYAVTADSMYSITPGSFQVGVRAELPEGVAAAAFSGSRLFVGFDDGTVRGYLPETFEETISGFALPEITLIAGTPEYLTVSAGSAMVVCHPGDLRVLGDYQAWGDVVHLSPVGNRMVSASIRGGNEVAILSLPGLELDLLFTVPGTPLVSAASPYPDSGYVFSCTDTEILAVVTSGGRIEWSTGEFGAIRDIVISSDGWNAVLLGRDIVHILEK
jgi:DNA-binding beta-propeller fold protein YncE